jgi:hypothetical protein
VRLWSLDLNDEFSDLYQKRELGDSANGQPNYLVGSTALCYDCHSGDHVDSDPDPSFSFDNPPQDVAFAGDRQVSAGGTPGYYELPDGRDPNDPLDAPDHNQILASPESHFPGGHYIMSEMGGASVSENYQVMSPTGLLLYEISVGDKIPCELCHDPHAGEISSLNDDEVFFRRQIYAGEDTIVGNNDGDFIGQVFKASHLSRAAQGVGEDDGTGREMCLYCHGSSDWDGGTGSSTAGLNPLITGGSGPIYTVYGIKVRTAAEPDGSPAFPPPATIFAHRSNSSQPCVDCHGHNDVQLPGGEGCLACHFAAKGAERETPAEDAMLGISAVDFNNDGHGNPAWGLQQGRECAYCHLTTEDGHPINTLDLANNPYRLRTTGGPGPANELCLACHSSAGIGVKSDSAGSPLTAANSSRNVNTAHWGLLHGGSDGGGWCWDCHNPHGNGTFTDNSTLIWARPALTSSSTTGMMTAPTASAVIFTGPSGYGTDYAPVGSYTGICQGCHTDPSLQWHVLGDGVKNSHNNTPAGGSSCTTCHPHSEAFRPLPCDSCHGNGAGDYQPDDDPLSEYPDRAGSHPKHIDALGTGNSSCDTCHPGNPPTDHLNQTATGSSLAEVSSMDLDSDTVVDAWGSYSFRNIAGALDTDAYYDATTFTCINVDCHGGVPTPDWYAPATADSLPPVWSTGSGIAAVDTENGGSVQVNWNTAVDAFPSNPVTYDLFMATANSASAVFAGPPVQADLAGTGVLITGLVDGTTYYFGVRAKDSWATPNVTTNSDITGGVTPTSLPTPAPCQNLEDRFDSDSLGSTWLIQREGASYTWSVAGSSLNLAAGPGDGDDPPRVTADYAVLNPASDNYNLAVNARIVDDDYWAIYFYTNQAADRGYAVILAEEAGKGYGIYRVEGPSLNGLADMTLLSAFDNQPVDTGGAGSDYMVAIQVRTTASSDVSISAWYEQQGGSLGQAAPVIDPSPNRVSGTIGFGTADLADSGQSLVRDVKLVCSAGGSGTCTVDPAGTYVDAENFNLLTPGINAHYAVATSLAPYIGSGNIETYGDSNMSVASGDRLDYYLNFPAPASTYYVWMRGRGLDANSDSVHIGGHGISNGRVLMDDIRDAWFWSREFSPNPIPGATNAINFAAGAGTINLWASELGTLIDGFYISTDPNPPPGLTTGPGASYLGTVPTGSTVVNPSACWTVSDTTPPLWSGGTPAISVTDTGAGGSLVISWNSASDSQSPPVTYELYRSTIQADVYSSPDMTWSGLVVTSLNDTGLVNGLTYWYGVRASDSNTPAANFSTNADTAWGIPTDTSILTCTSCHQLPPDQPGNTGSHPAHTDTDSDLTECGNCHPGTLGYTMAHQDGLGQLGLSGTAYSAAYAGDTVVYNDGATDLYVDGDGYGQLTGSTGDGTDDGTCYTAACHGTGTPVWGDPSSVMCGSCHGRTAAVEDRSSYADTDGSVQGAPPDDLAAGQDPGKVGKHLEHADVSFAGTGDSCDLCHLGAGRGAVLHTDGMVNVIFHSYAGTGAAYDTATNSCSGLDNAGCHGGNTWDVTSTLLCLDCHGGAMPAASVSSASPHTDMGLGYTCEGCHTSHSGGTLTIPNLAAVGISYAAGGISLGGSQAAGATEAQVCWNCHDAQAVPVSEWGATTGDTNSGSWPDYDYGTLHDNSGSWGARTATSDWTTAWWDSSSFRYKTERIQSTHAANPSAGSEGMDAVGAIRCSYCHDLHDTFTGSPTGTPYLRGTWMQNPYREDGAPRYDAGGDQHAYAENQSYGAVPRANRGPYTSHLNTSGRPDNWSFEMGGYWIDQNSGFPSRDDAAFDSPEETAGLCELCHGDGDGTWTPGEIDNIDQFAGTNNWFGGNGHANAVLGGSGIASSMATNIMSQAARGNPLDCTAPDQFNGDDLWDSACMGYFGQQSGNELYGVRNNNERSWFYRNRDRGTGVFPHMENPDTARAARFAYDKTRGAGFEWGNWWNATDPVLTQDDLTVDDRYHRFTCSKCHNPHASRLPRLMITNCLDVAKNTYDDQTTFDGRQGFTGDDDWTTGSNGPYTNLVQAPGNRELSYLATAQNCHRRVDPATGWNRVTPW